MSLSCQCIHTIPIYIPYHSDSYDYHSAICTVYTLQVSRQTSIFLYVRRTVSAFALVLARRWYENVILFTEFRGERKRDRKREKKGRRENSHNEHWPFETISMLFLMILPMIQLYILSHAVIVPSWFGNMITLHSYTSILVYVRYTYRRAQTI